MTGQVFLLYIPENYSQQITNPIALLFYAEIFYLKNFNESPLSFLECFKCRI